LTYGQQKPINYSVDPKTGCWNVVSHAPDGRGYPRVKRNRQQMKVHRYSYELAYGSIPDGLFCCHHCDNKQCINPKHLFLGTNADNIQDAARKGRMVQRDQHGEANSNHRLTESDVIAIRADKTSLRRVLGRKYGVSRQHIGLIKRGKRWGWLK